MKLYDKGPSQPPQPRHVTPEQPPPLCHDSDTEDSCRVTTVEPLVSYLESTVPTAACEMAIVYRSASCACFACHVLHLRALLLRHFLHTATAMARKKTTADELSARAKANGYQLGVHGDKDSLRDRNKQG
jgi:hypothetical protein